MDGGLGKMRGSHSTQRADSNKRQRKQIHDTFGHISRAILVPLCFGLQPFLSQFVIYPLYNICDIVSLFLFIFSCEALCYFVFISDTF